MQNRIVLTLSGGMDSSTMLHMAAADPSIDEIYTIAFDYGQRHKRELNCVCIQQADAEAKHGVKIIDKRIDVRYIRDIAPTSSLTNDDISTPNIKEIAGDAQPLSYVPFRNNMFVSIAASYAEAVGASEVWYGSAQADSLAGYWDSSEEWLEKMNDLISLNRKSKIKLVTPLINMSKEEIIEEGVNLKVRFDDTWTCYSGNVIADADSPSSSLRLKGFIDSGYVDPIIYKQQEKLSKIYKDMGCKLIPYIPYNFGITKFL